MLSGADPGFQIRGDALKKIAPSGGRCENFGGISCEKITILRQKIIFFPIAEGGAKNFGVFRVKNHDYTPTNHIFSNFRGGGGARRVRPLPPGYVARRCFVVDKKKRSLDKLGNVLQFYVEIVIFIRNQVC